MVAKRVMTPMEQMRVRELLQGATVQALMDSRRWEPGDLAFQGGTCLHLVHDSVRFSEDLDFMIRGGLSTKGLSKEVQRRLQGSLGLPADLQITVSRAKDESNPHAFSVTLGSPDVIGSARVKIELWETPPHALRDLAIMVKMVGPAGGVKAAVPALTLGEVFSDKVYALGARARLKPRDVYDLWWLSTEHRQRLDHQGLLLRLQIYPNGAQSTEETAQIWLESAQQRLRTLGDEQTVVAVAKDLRRWLPRTWDMSDVKAAQMLETCKGALQEGIEVMLGHVAHEKPAAHGHSQKEGRL